MPSRIARHLPFAGKEPFSINFMPLGLLYTEALRKGRYRNLIKKQQSA